MDKKEEEPEQEESDGENEFMNVLVESKFMSVSLSIFIGFGLTVAWRILLIILHSEDSVKDKGKHSIADL